MKKKSVKAFANHVDASCRKNAGNTKLRKNLKNRWPQTKRFIKARQLYEEESP